MAGRSRVAAQIDRKAMTPERWQKITDVFHASLEGDAAGRDPFLDRACAGDRELRAEVEAMLKAHEGASNAMAVLDQSCAGDDTLRREIEAFLPFPETTAHVASTPLRTNEALSQYRVLEQAGAGGMSVVYKALDIKLDRHVALKFLPEKFAADRGALERFQREARAVAALDHPNICTIHSIAEDSGRPFIVMQWVDGQTLRQRIGKKPLPLDEVVDLGIQIADALEKVHAQGVIHRDIKPANLMVTPEGQAKILDFGIAKVRETERRANHLEAPADTGTGMVVGTAGYMSPEQVLGQTLDSRSDLFSLGVVLYEMATGVEPFTGDTPGAISDQILHRTPPAPSTLNEKVSPGLDRVIVKALEKTPEQRYQHASELSSDLADLGLRKRPIGSVDVSRSWRHRRWLLAAAALLVGVAGAVWWGMQGSALNFEPLDTVMLGNIHDSTGEEVLNGTIGRALRIALEQSRYVDVLPEARVSQALVARQKPAGAIASEDIAREICHGEGAKILIGASLAGAGGGYELGMRLVDCDTGRTVRTLREPVASRAQILAGVDRIARNLRLELGEPSRSLAVSQPKPDHATTSSLEAFKFFIDGNALIAKRNYVDARVLLKRAVEIDPEFAQAYASLGLTYAPSRNVVDDSRQAEHYFQEALKRLDRVTERERLEIQASYHGAIGDEQKAASYCRLLVDAYPKVSRYRYNLASALRSLRLFAAAIREYEAFLRLEPNSPDTLINIAVSYSELEQLDQAAAYYEKAFAISPGFETDLIQNHQYGWLQVVRGEEDRARAFFNKMLGKSRVARARGHRSLGILALYHGRFAEARQHLEEASRFNDVSGVFDSAGRDLLYLGDALVLVGRTQEGVQQLDRARALFEKGSSERGAMSTLSNAYARAGQTSRAAKVLALLKMRARPGNFTDATLVFLSEGELALAQHATEESVEKLRRARAAVDATATQLALAEGLMRTGHKEEAIALYESVVAKRAPTYNGQVRWVLAHRDLGRLYDASGQTDKARSMYQKMLDLWADADPGLQPLEDVRRAIKRLGK